MKRVIVVLLACLFAVDAHAQTPTPPRSLLNRMLHPFGSRAKKAPRYSDPHVRGLLLEVSIQSEPVKLSEVRQMRVRAMLSNTSGYPVILDFPNAQRIEILLLNSAGEVLTKWSENRMFAQEVGTVLVNPREQIVYDEAIATRELQAGKVYTVEVFFPKYPELRVRQKFLTAP
jgi:hypothetical protein